MAEYNLLYEYSVRINKGSGVLVNAMSQEYSYILTAKHVIKDAKLIKIYDNNNVLLDYIDVYEHPEKDCVLITVKHNKDVKQMISGIQDVKHNSPLMLAGYPAVRNNDYKAQGGSLNSYRDQEFVFITTESTPKSIIEGFSGGGVYCLQEDLWHLIGIEYRMDGDDEDEHYDRLRCYSLQPFNEIIQQNDLPCMLPGFMESFIHVADKIFDFNVVNEANIAILQEKLREIAMFLIENKLPAPYELMMEYEADLLLKDKSKNILLLESFWIAISEFLVICAVIDNNPQLSLLDIKSLDKKRRFIYLNQTENWVRNLKEILEFCKQKLDVGGVLIIDSLQSDAALHPPGNFLSRVINDIASVPSESGFFQIDDTNDDYYRSFIITHLKALHKKNVIEKEFEYENKSPRDALEYFKDGYNETIK